MGYETALDVIAQRLATWSATAISWEGFGDEPYSVPDPTVYWIKPRVEILEGAWVALGGTMVGSRSKARTWGILFIELNGPLGDGSETLSQHADSLVTLFDGYSSNRVVFREKGHARPMTATDFARWLVSCPFQYDEMKSY